MESTSNKEIYCPCCDYDTFKNVERYSYAICPICFWEDDPFQLDEPEEEGSNHVSLNQARINFAIFQACEKEMIKNCRTPNSKDKKRKL